MLKKIKEHPFFWSAVFAILVVFLINADTGATLLLVYFFVGMFWLLGKAIKVAVQKATNKKKKPTVKPVSKNEAPAPHVQQAPQTLSTPPDQINGCERAYSSSRIAVYTEDRTIFELPGVEVGQSVEFFRDRNHHDSGAVAVLVEGCIVGYLHDSKVRNMVRGWLKEERPLYAQISSVSPSAINGLTINIVFYK